MAIVRPSPPTSAFARLLAAAALLAALVPVVDTHLAPASAAVAANFFVNLASDPGDGTCDGTCTLRDAILNAGSLAGHDTITFSPAVTTPIVLASALPVIAQALTIDGSGQAITLDGASLYRPLLATAPLTITALTIQRGRAPNDGFGGGGAYFGSAGTIWGVSFISNTALGTGGGGAYFATSAILSGATFISNTVTNGNGGGAFVGATAVVTGSTFMTNTTNFNGGGLAVLASATVTGSTFISNTAHADGGGVYVFGDAAVTGTTFIRNRALVIFNSSGGGALFQNTASLANTTFISNSAVLDGGGVKIWGAATVSDSTFTGNSSGSGGGLYLTAGGPLTNTTFNSNTALVDGGGLYLAATTATLAPTNGDIVPITGATFTGNRALAGGGGGAYATGPTAISGSAFRGNSAATSGGGLNVQDTGIIIATSFTTNTATGPGGGARFGGPANLQGTTFGANTAGGNGGGAAFDLYSILTQTTFYGNQTTGHGTHGGGAWLGGGATLTGTTFLSNTAQNGNGGGLWGTGATVTNTTVTGNQALCPGGLASPASGNAPASHDCGDGGGGYLSGAFVWFFGQFSSNHADDDGGGGYFEASGIADNGMTFVEFRDNSANGVGGGVVAEAIRGSWGAIEFEDNEAGIDGSALFIDGSFMRLVNSTISDNHVTALGGADVSMSFSDSHLDLKHVTFSPRPTGFRLAVSVGTDLPDEHGQQDTVARLTNTIFHGYDIGMQGQSPTSTVEMTGVLWSSVNTPWQIGNFNISLDYTGPAGFVDEAGGNFHLTAASHAINRGVPTDVTTDIDGEPRPQGLAPDLGADEFIDLSSIRQVWLPIILKQ